MGDLSPPYRAYQNADLLSMHCCSGRCVAAAYVLQEMMGVDACGFSFLVFIRVAHGYMYTGSTI